jgi:hypothetical protein
MNLLAEIHVMHEGASEGKARLAGTKAASAKIARLRAEWAALNGVTVRRQGFSLTHLARAQYPDWRDPSWCFQTWPGLDHPHWFWAAHRPATMTVEPYHADALPALRAHAARFGLAVHAPPNPFASFHYPGRTVLAVLTRPGLALRWLGDQLTYEGREVWA